MAKLTIADAFSQVLDGPLPLRFTAYDGSASGPEDAPFGLDLKTERGLAYLMTAPGDLGLGRAYVSGDLDVSGVHPGDPYEALKALQAGLRLKVPSAADALRLATGSASPTSSRRRRRRRRRCRAGAGSSRECATRASATTRRSTTTTTCRTRSTSTCWARR